MKGFGLGWQLKTNPTSSSSSPKRFCLAVMLSKPGKRQEARGIRQLSILFLSYCSIDPCLWWGFFKAIAYHTPGFR
jgi:hypothetical protein